MYGNFNGRFVGIIRAWDMIRSRLCGRCGDRGTFIFSFSSLSRIVFKCNEFFFLVSNRLFARCGGENSMFVVELFLGGHTSV